MWLCLESILKAVHGDLFMVMDRPLRKGNNECEWEKAEKIMHVFLQSWTEVVVTPTPSPRIQCCHVKSQFNIDLGAGCYNIFVQDCS